MRYRPLGSSGLRVSELFLGAMTFGLEGGVGSPALTPLHLRATRVVDYASAALDHAEFPGSRRGTW